MGELQKKIDAVMRLVTAATESERNKAMEEVRSLLNSEPAPDPESIIRNILLEIGAPDHLLGHPMVIEGVMLALEDRGYSDNLTHQLYPKLAECFDTTALRVERAIRHLIETTWVHGDMDAQDKYFGATVDPNKGRPTSGQFISRLVNITRAQLKAAYRVSA